jgi:Fic family protein
MHPITARAVAAMVVNMNSYYSNLIEGHFTHPLDIDKALKKDYSADKKKHILQLESAAHIHVNEAMRERLASDPAIDICSVDFLCGLHREFYNQLPDVLRSVRGDSDQQWEVIPGELRRRDVKVGNHIAPDSNALSGFMDRFDSNYKSSAINDPMKRILAIAASHHRLAWIHPFLDGNGRVVRLFSEAYFIKEGLSADGLWSISRGLAVFRKEYYERLANADLKRINDYDGRGNLSDTHLLEFCIFFLQKALDQVKFMSSLFDIDTMLNRIDDFADLMAQRGEMRKEAKYILREVFLCGRLSKGDMTRIIGKSRKVAAPLMNDLLAKDLIRTGEGLRAPLTINFPIRYSPYLFPRLYPPDIEATLM